MERGERKTKKEIIEEREKKRNIKRDGKSFRERHRKRKRG
jgi:hypothetical protein